MRYYLQIISLSVSLIFIIFVKSKGNFNEHIIFYIFIILLTISGIAYLIIKMKTSKKDKE